MGREYRGGGGVVLESGVGGIMQRILAVGVAVAVGVGRFGRAIAIGLPSSLKLRRDKSAGVFRPATTSEARRASY